MASGEVESGSGVLTRAAAERALVDACGEVGLVAAGTELIRLGSSAVYRIRTRVVARVSPNGKRLADARREVAVSRWLADEGFPATRALDVSQPVEAGGHVVTFWESASEREEYAPIDLVAAMIRDFHRLEPPASLGLAVLDPFARSEERLRSLVGLDAEDAAFLRSASEKARHDWASLRFALPTGVIHGDASVGNVILDRTGNPLLIDLDEVSVGPREWDLVQTALYFDRLGWHSKPEYETFVRIYGYDVMEWSGYSTLADIREVLMVQWLAARAAHDDQAAAEVRKRIAAIRYGGSRQDWRPY